MMDSRSQRLPFLLSSSRPSYTSSQSVSSPSLGSTRLYSRETLLNNDRFPRTSSSSSSSYKADLERQNSRLLRHSRDYSSSDSCSGSWKLPSSLTSSSRSYDRPWADSSLSSRSKPTDSEARLGMRSVLLNASEDGDSKRAKLSYSNRGLYSRTPSTSTTGSTYSSKSLSSGRGTSDSQNDTYDSSWSSYRLLSRPSSSSSDSLSSRREMESKNEPIYSALGEEETGPQDWLPHFTERMTSSYAQGARPKETAYCPSSPSSSSSYSPSTARESAVNRHLSSSTSHRSSPLLLDINNSRTSTRFSNSSSSLHSSQEQTGNHQSSYNMSSSYSSHTPWYASPPARPESTLPPRPAPEGGESDSRSSTRRLLSRLFSRRSSQDSSSGASSVRSVDDDLPSTGGESVDSDELDTAGSDAASGGLRNRRADLAPIQENNNGGYRNGPPRPRMSMWREPGISSSNNTSSGGGSSYSWLSSSLRGRCPPLLARLRRHARDESAHSATGSEGYVQQQPLLRRWDEHKTSPDDDDDDDEDEDDEDEEEDDDDDEEVEEEQQEGAVGLGAFGAIRPNRLEEETLPELQNASVGYSPRRRVGVYENVASPQSPLDAVSNQLEGPREKQLSSGDQEKLRRIKERLLLEESDEEEGDLCRICQMGEESATNPLIQPCHCTGSLQYVHQDCIKRWLRSKIGSGTNIEAITTCELCKQKLRLNIDNFDIQELYRTHVQSEYDEFISSGLYLVVLLHFCEQRFSDVLGAVDAAGLFNLVRILHEHMDNLEIPHGESDDETRDHRPSIEFSDLDEDLEDY